MMNEFTDHIRMINLSNDFITQYQETGIDMDSYSKDAEMVEKVLSTLTDICLSAAQKAVSGYTAEYPTIYEVYVHAGNVMWSEFADRINAAKIPLKTPNDQGDTELYMEPRGFLIMMLQLEPATRNLFIPTLEKYMMAEWAVSNKTYDEIYNTKEPEHKRVNPDIPYEVHDRVFQDSGMSELIRKFQDLGEYRPNRDYDDPEKLKKHDELNEFIDKLFRSEDVK